MDKVLRFIRQRNSLQGRPISPQRVLRHTGVKLQILEV